MYVNRTKAVKLRCLDCCCGIKKQIRECDSEDCVLYEIRNTGKFIGERAGSRRNKAIRDYCASCMGDNQKMIRECTDNLCSFYQYSVKTKK